MKEARELCRLKLYEAAQLIGLNTDKLEKIEGGTDFDAIPLSAIQRAAKIYDVSADFLLCISEDWEHDPVIRQQRDFLSHVQSKLVETQAKTAAQLIQQQAEINVINDTVQSLAPAIKSINDSVIRFWEINPEFETMLGSAPIVSRLEQANKAVHRATLAMLKQNLLPLDALQDCAVVKAPIPKSNPGDSQPVIRILLTPKAETAANYA